MSFNEQKKSWFTFIFMRFVEGIWLQLPELQSSAISICSCNSSSLTNSSPFIRWKVLFWSPLNLMAPPTILGFWKNKRKYVISFCWLMQWVALVTKSLFVQFLFRPLYRRSNYLLIVVKKLLEYCKLSIIGPKWRNWLNLWFMCFDTNLKCTFYNFQCTIFSENIHITWSTMSRIDSKFQILTSRATSDSNTSFAVFSQMSKKVAILDFGHSFFIRWIKSMGYLQCCLTMWRLP